MWFIPLSVSFSLKKTRSGWQAALRVNFFI